MLHVERAAEMALNIIQCSVEEHKKIISCKFMFTTFAAHHKTTKQKMILQY